MHTSNHRGQQRVIAERHDRLFLLGTQHCRVRCLRTHSHIRDVIAFLPLGKTVLGLIPHCFASVLMLASLLWIARRTVSVVVARLRSTYP